MQGLVFESTESVTQEQFAEFIAERERAGDTGHYELLNGRVVMNPPAGYPHGQIGNRLQRVLGNYVAEHNLGEVFDSSQGFDLPSGDTVEPDHAFVSKERWSQAPPPELGKFLRVVPDLIVEVLSTRTASQDRGEKKAVYEKNSVLEYWLVDPRARIVTVFQSKDGRFDSGRKFSESERCASQVLSGLEFDVSEILV